MKMKNLNVLVVDDENHARKKIVSFLKEREVEIIHEAANGISAVELIEKENPDIVFLDIRMPKLHGLEVVETIGVDRMPITIFTTAFDQYAINAFEIGAIDYLLKPFDENRFDTAFKRAAEKLTAEKDTGDSFEKLINELSPKQYYKKFLVKKGSKYIFVNTDDIYFISSLEKYAELNTREEKFLIRSSMIRLEKRLDPSKFKRSHRSYIVNDDKVKEIESWSHGDYIMILTNGEKVKLSRRFRAAFFEK